MVDAIQNIGNGNSLVNQADNTSLPSRIEQAIKTAAAKTGVSFTYLMNKASQESSFDPNAKSSSSSATGLFQFTNQTWLQMVKTHGAQYGLGNYADHIQTDASGAAHVDNPTWRQAILAMRKDPQISAEMAGELDKENGATLQSNVGGKIGATDLYLAHFLGAGGATDFLNKMKANPSAKAADVLPEAAAANPNVFYSADGTARSLNQIYKHFAQKFDSPSTPTMVASAQPTVPTPLSTASASASRYMSTMNTYAMASAATTPANSSASLSSQSFAPSVQTAIKANSSSSLFATMVLAQMDVAGGSNTPGMSDASQVSGWATQSRKSAIDVLGATA